MRLVKTMLVLIAALVVTPAVAQDNMQILRDKIKADKKLVVASNMDLSESEAKGFWPVYDGYQMDLQKVNERIGRLIRSYAAAYNKGAVPDETAKKLLNELIAVEAAEVKLKRDYVPKLEQVLPGSKVARYMQIENKIRAIVKYELAARVPLVAAR